MRVYLSDARAVQAHGSWMPTRTPTDILRDIHTWVSQHEQLVLSALR